MIWAMIWSPSRSPTSRTKARSLILSSKPGVLAPFSEARPGAPPGQPASNDVFGGQCADLITIGDLDLDRCVLDAKAVMQLLGDAVEDGVARVAAWHHEMTGQ